MALRRLDHHARLRARRWDALVLGSGIAGLVAAGRLALAGRRTLVVEEAAARDAFPGLREPFFLAGANQGPLDTCLRDLRVPLIDRRRIVSQACAYQVIGDELRLEVGDPEATAGELVAWGLAKPEAAQKLVAWIGDASHPPDVARVRAEAPGLADLLAAQARALSNLAHPTATDAATPDALASALAGGAGFEDGPPWLAGILRRRLESLGVEFRSVPGRFELVEVDGGGGIWIESSCDLWLGRALVLAARDAALAKVLEAEAIPSFLDLDSPLHRRQAFLFACPRSARPEAMAPRLILLDDDPAHPHATVATYPDPLDPHRLLLLARRVLRDDESRDDAEASILARLATLLTFDGDSLRPAALVCPIWDDDDWLQDPIGETPSRLVTRLSQHPAIYRLERSAVAKRGLVGDLSLGWRGGEQIADALS